MHAICRKILDHLRRGGADDALDDVLVGPEAIEEATMLVGFLDRRGEAELADRAAHLVARAIGRAFAERHEGVEARARQMAKFAGRRAPADAAPRGDGVKLHALYVPRRIA